MKLIITQLELPPAHPRLQGKALHVMVESKPRVEAARNILVILRCMGQIPDPDSTVCSACLGLQDLQAWQAVKLSTYPSHASHRDSIADLDRHSI